MVNKIVNEYVPEYVSHPGETLEDVLEEKGMTQAELAKRTGRPKKTINEIINGKAAITPETAIQFEKVFDIPSSFWNNRQCIYDAYIAKTIENERLKQYIDWLKLFPIGNMVTLNWINKFSDKVMQLNELLTFFGVNSPDEWKLVWRHPKAAFRQSPSFNRNIESSSVWFRKGEIEANKIPCQRFNRNLFRNVLNEIVNLTTESPDAFEEKIINLCAATGVAVVFIPTLKGVPVYGVTRWLTPEKALIQLTLRGKYEDIFWFSFFHEAGHILLHGKRDIFIESSEKIDTKEDEADTFAKNILIPQKKWNAFTTAIRYFSKKEVVNFAQQLSVSPAIIVGRLQHERLIPHSHMNELRRKYEIIKSN